MKSSLKLNVLANLAGGAWISLLSLVCVPLYLRYLGIEAYGLIGFFATLTAVLGLMDAGLGTTANRALARLSARQDTLAQQRDLLRTLEWVYWTVSIIAGVAIIASAGWIATSWIHSKDLASGTVTTSIHLMGVVFALQFPFALYQNGLAGLQRQTVMNVVIVITGTLRSLGAVAILALVSNTVQAFFVWQAFITIIQTASMAICLWHSLRSPSAPHFRSSILRAEIGYASSVAASSVLAVILTQSDRLLLSGLLSLQQFGYYALAGTVAAALWWLIVPLSGALFPRFTQLMEIGDECKVADLYHTATQVMAVLVLPVGATLAFFGAPIIEIWTHNATAAANAAPVVALLAAGTSLNALAVVPASLQSAAGWPQLMMLTNVAEALLLIPAIYYAATHYGTQGAASIWVIMNLIYVIVTAPIMHRRILRGHFLRWLFWDAAKPLAVVVICAGLIRAFMPLPEGKIATLFAIGVSYGVMLAAVLIAAPRARQIAVSAIHRRRCSSGASETL